MQIFNKLNGLNLNNISLALGFFDGVHKGHQKVIKTATETADKSAVITFKKHPLETFGIQVKYINSFEKRVELIEELGVDYLFEIDFTEELSQMTGSEYLKMICETFIPQAIVTGFNHTFGKKQSGSPNLLSEYQEIFGYKYIQIPPQKINNEVISSTLIKEALLKGDIEKANKMLGYDFTIKGEVIEGNKIGKTIGFPTANIIYPEAIIEIPYGVYATKIFNNNSITNFGIKPTIKDNNNPIVESHILNFDKNIYNTDIDVVFKKKIRNEKKFESLEDLKEQIRKDIEQCSKS